MILHFKDGIAGFYLKSGKDDEQLNNTLYELGLVNSSIDSEGNITHYAFTFFPEKLGRTESIDLEMDESDYGKVPGLYSVPELNIENKSFIDVINAVKQYYTNKKAA